MPNDEYRSFLGRNIVLEKRVEGLRQAVVKWRIKAKADIPPNKPQIVTSERVLRHRKGTDEWFYLVSYALPIEKNPALIREAWQWLEDNSPDETMASLKRVFFHEKHGWVATLEAEW